MPGAAVALALAAVCAPAAQPPADTPYIARTLLDRTLVSHPVLLHRLDAGMIVYTDERGLLRREPTSEFLGILPSSNAGPAEAPGPDTDLLTLVDAQRFPGVLLEAGDEDEPPVPWDAGFARLEFSLEHVRSLVRAGYELPFDLRTASTPTTDSIGLANADRLRGFVLALGQTSAIETDAGVVDIEADRLAWARLANPDVPPPPTLLWLTDGAIAGVELLPQTQSDALEARLVPPGGGEPSLSDAQAPRLSILMARLRAASFDAAALVPLGTLPVAGVASSRPWTPSPEIGDASAAPLGAPDITLPAPMSVTWVIPPDAARLAFEALMPERSRLWGDAELVVVLEQDTREQVLTRVSISGASPLATINVVLPSPAERRRERRLRIELREGPSGPAQDMAIIRRPLLLRATR